MDKIAFKNLISSADGWPEIHVSNISENVTISDLNAKFSLYGPIRLVRIQSSKTAIIQYEKLRSALRAVKSANGFNLGGKEIIVEENQSREAVPVPTVTGDQMLEKGLPPAKKSSIGIVVGSLQGLEIVEAIGSRQERNCEIVIFSNEMILGARGVVSQLNTTGIRASLLEFSTLMSIQEAHATLRSLRCDYAFLFPTLALNNLALTITFTPYKRQSTLHTSFEQRSGAGRASDQPSTSAGVQPRSKTEIEMTPPPPPTITAFDFVRNIAVAPFRAISKVLSPPSPPTFSILGEAKKHEATGCSPFLRQAVESDDSDVDPREKLVLYQSSIQDFVRLIPELQRTHDKLPLSDILHHIALFLKAKFDCAELSADKDVERAFKRAYQK